MRGARHAVRSDQNITQLQETRKNIIQKDRDCFSSIPLSTGRYKYDREAPNHIQKYVDHSISVTVNLPENVTEEIVSKVYETGWRSGCKGITVYRDGSRQGVIMSNEGTTQNVVKDVQENNAKPRPKKLECDVVRFTNNKEKWVGFLGLMVDDTGEKYPYELFAFIRFFN